MPKTTQSPSPEAPITKPSLVPQTDVEPTVELTPEAEETQELTADADDIIELARPVKDANGIVVAWELYRLTAADFRKQTNVSVGGVAASPPHILDEYVNEAKVRANALAGNSSGSGINVTPVVDVGLE